MLPLDLHDAFLPTHFVGYLNDLMSDLGIWKCLGKSAFRSMRLPPQNLVATCSRDFDFKLDNWIQMHFCWLSQRPHARSWNLKMSWKVCIQANATASSELGGNVFSRFRFQVGWLEQDAFLPTHFVGYLNDLMSDLGIWKCLGKSAFRRMRLPPQNLVATCSRDFDFKLDDWNQMQFDQHFVVTLQQRR
jgi:hypothetical protein